MVAQVISNASRGESILRRLMDEHARLRVPTSDGRTRKCFYKEATFGIAEPLDARGSIEQWSPARSRVKGEIKDMPIELNSPLWAVLADWVKVILTLPDPPPDPLLQINDVALVTVISALTARLSPEVGAELRRALP